MDVLARLGFTQMNVATLNRDGSGYPLNDAAPGTAASASILYQSRDVYRRLLRYAKPYTGMYLLGVLGMILYAGTDLITVKFVRTYLQDTMALQRNPQVLQLAAARRAVDLPGARRWRLPGQLFSLLGGAAGHQGNPQRSVWTIPAAADGTV